MAAHAARTFTVQEAQHGLGHGEGDGGPAGHPPPGGQSQVELLVVHELGREEEARKGGEHLRVSSDLRGEGEDGVPDGVELGGPQDPDPPVGPARQTQSGVTPCGRRQRLRPPGTPGPGQQQQQQIASSFISPWRGDERGRGYLLGAVDEDAVQDEEPAAAVSTLEVKETHKQQQQQQQQQQLCPTCSLEMISSLVALTMLMSSTAKAGYEMMASTPASTSLDMEALGSMDVCVCVYLAVLDVVSQGVHHGPRAAFRPEEVEVVQSFKGRLEDSIM
ncbi:hypothetical protein EYF80_047917 [Liparis tanakae]|uniref:Uncharacterized protein n=1 Tax=Liparis tanakae TaxID=230148 RepID=A0A4Z2FLM5_9TELE|nr:hypothetical protein EYF80_047917 [Liparis tanakae]